MHCNFYWSEIDWQAEQSPIEKYQQCIRWAEIARGQNPNAFDEITAWILDDAEWTADKLDENEQFLMQGLIARFKTQTEQFRIWLKELEPHGVVNEAVWDALDNFEQELSGRPHDKKRLGEPVAQMFADFSAMQDRRLREQIAGDKTGPLGTDSIETLGYINHLKNLDAAVQWALFMPQVVANQQQGFSIESFAYKTMPPMRFIGRECDDSTATPEGRQWIFDRLDSLSAYKSGHDYDILLIHHYGKGVDVEDGHAFWGRFFKADTPVPESLVSFDFIPHFDNTPGAPFGSQFAFATFKGDYQAIHKEEGFDANAMYDITRNTMLGQNVTIPYPEKYWTAEVFLNEHAAPSTAYMFSADF